MWQNVDQTWTHEWFFFVFFCQFFQFGSIEADEILWHVLRQEQYQNFIETYLTRADLIFQRRQLEQQVKRLNRSFKLLFGTEIAWDTSMLIMLLLVAKFFSQLSKFSFQIQYLEAGSSHLSRFLYHHGSDWRNRTQSLMYLSACAVQAHLWWHPAWNPAVISCWSKKTASLD